MNEETAVERQNDPPRWVATRRDYVFAAAFVLLWLVPMLGRGLIHVPYGRLFMNRKFEYEGSVGKMVGPWANTVDYISNISCLFTRRTPTWTTHYVQGLPHDSLDWVELQDAYYSPMSPFGHRSRMDRMIANNHFWTYHRDPAAQRNVSEMAQWYRDRYAQLHPDEPPLHAVRFVLVRYVSGTEIAEPAGHWVKPPLDAIPEDRIVVMDVRYFEP